MITQQLMMNTEDLQEKSFFNTSLFQYKRISHKKQKLQISVISILAMEMFLLYLMQVSFFFKWIFSHFS
jgi:hypothetical protein